MKHTKGVFPFKADLTKKSGFGPRAGEGTTNNKGKFEENDSTKEFAKSRYEMGEYQYDPTETDSDVEKREDAEGK